MKPRRKCQGFEIVWFGAAEHAVGIHIPDRLAHLEIGKSLAENIGDAIELIEKNALLLKR